MAWVPTVNTKPDGWDFTVLEYPSTTATDNLFQSRHLKCSLCSTARRRPLCLLRLLRSNTRYSTVIGLRVQCTWDHVLNILHVILNADGTSIIMSLRACATANADLIWYVCRHAAIRSEAATALDLPTSRLSKIKPGWVDTNLANYRIIIRHIYRPSIKLHVASAGFLCRISMPDFSKIFAFRGFVLHSIHLFDKNQDHPFFPLTVRFRNRSRGLFK